MFDKSITKQSHNGNPGDIAVVYDQKKKFLAVGIYDPSSPIRVRLLQHRKAVTINREWFLEKVGLAWDIRKPLATTGTNGFRVIHGENDGLPGLVVDIYAGTLVIKIYTTAWIPHLSNVLLALTETIDVKKIVLRMSRICLGQPDFLYGLKDGQLLFGPSIDEPLVFKENGLLFEADPVHGQKTGFFLDQRDNRAKVEKLAFGKDVLNVFSYTGGFSLYSARGGARSVTSLDSSKQAIAGAKRNFKLNVANAHVNACTKAYIIDDAFKAMKQLASDKKSYSMVIIDPPSFAKKQKETAEALHAYSRLVTLGLGILRNGGTLVMASCSAHILADDFFKMIFTSAKNGGHKLIEIDRTGHAPDHPITFPEGAYLKCLFAQKK